MSQHARAPTREDLIRLARERFLQGRRLDIQSLAEELGVSRATAYRWAGNAEQLAGTVIAKLGEETFERCLREARGCGWEKILDVQERGMTYISTFKPYRAFLAANPERALRIVASKEGAPQTTTIRLNQWLLEDEERRGNLRLPIDAHTLAYALVRIVESFLYADLIVGEEPDVHRAMQVLRLLLREAP